MPKPALSKISTVALTEELQRRQRDLPKLQKARNELVERLAQLDRDIASLSGTTPAAPAAALATEKHGASKKKKSTRRRPVNTESLNDALARVLSKDKPMTNQEAADAVLKAGYKTNSTNFRTIVTQVLSRDERFKAASRGQYVLA